MPEQYIISLERKTHELAPHETVKSECTPQQMVLLGMKKYQRIPNLFWKINKP